MFYIYNGHIEDYVIIEGSIYYPSAHCTYNTIVIFFKNQRVLMYFDAGLLYQLLTITAISCMNCRLEVLLEYNAPAEPTNNSRQVFQRWSLNPFIGRLLCFDFKGIR